MNEHYNLPAFLTENSLIFQQTSGFMSNDFQIQNSAEQVLGDFVTQGDGLSRMVMGSRNFDLIGADGLVYLKLNDEITFGRDRFEIYSGNDERLASVVQNIALFSTKVTVEMAQGLILTLQGSPLKFDFDVLAGTHRAAAVSRAWAGMGKGLMGRSRYNIELDPGAPPEVRLAIFGTVLALDLIRAKASKN